MPSKNNFCPARAASQTRLKLECHSGLGCILSNTQLPSRQSLAQKDQASGRELLHDHGLANRFNRFRKENGHVFQGRYKALQLRTIPPDKQ
jgi:hypothetical protein